MRSGRTLQDLATEVARQQEAKRDFLAAPERLTLLTERAGPPHPSELSIESFGEFGMRPLAHTQLGERLEVPPAYYRRLQDRHPVLLDQTVNALLRSGDRRGDVRSMVRTMDGDVRAVLSTSYRRLDHSSLLESILPVLQGLGPEVQFPSLEVTEDRLYVKAVIPGLQGEVRKGDVVQAGLAVMNSETGLGALSVFVLVHRLVCLNGMIGENVLRQTHLGARLGYGGGGGDDAFELFSDTTKRATDRALFMQLTDTVRSAVSEVRFRQMLGSLQEAAASPQMVRPTAAVEELSKALKLTEAEQDGVLNHLIRGGDLSQWGAINAITAHSQEVQSYDRATELEAIGGQVLKMTGPQWRTIAEAGRDRPPQNRSRRSS
jgi:hypothetical protein